MYMKALLNQSTATQHYTCQKDRAILLDSTEATSTTLKEAASLQQQKIKARGSKGLFHKSGDLFPCHLLQKVLNYLVSTLHTEIIFFQRHCVYIQVYIMIPLCINRNIFRTIMMSESDRSVCISFHFPNFYLMLSKPLSHQIITFPFTPTRSNSEY